MDRGENNKLSYNLIIVSFLFLGFISSIFIGSCILFIFKIPITKINFIIFPIVTLIVTKFILDKDNKKFKWKFFIYILILFFILIGILAVINNFIWDTSYDSLSYHQETIIRLYNGWNPFYETVGISNLWVLHYTKAPAIFGAALYKLTGRIESAKVLSTLMPIILFMFSYSIFNLISQNKRKVSYFISVLLVANPVILAQVFSYYVDSILGIYIIILIMNLYFIIFYNELFFFKYFTLINIATFLINIKFTGLAYAIVILFAFLIINFIYNKKGNNIRLIAFLISGFIFAVIIIGFHPYVTNFVTKGHPLYPLAGENKEDIMTTNIPNSFRNDNEFIKAIKASIGAISFDENEGNVRGVSEVFKINSHTLYYYSFTDPRIRGFGFYSPIFLSISFVSMIYLLIKYRRKKISICTTVMLTSICFAMIYGGDFWWARYVPYIWAIPVMVGFIFLIDNNKVLKKIAVMLFTLMILNCFFISIMSIGGKAWRSNELKKYIFSNELKIKSDIFSGSFINKAREYNLDFSLIEK